MPGTGERHRTCGFILDEFLELRVLLSGYPPPGSRLSYHLCSRGEHPACQAGLGLQHILVLHMLSRY